MDISVLRGKTLVIEGDNGAGKETQTELLANRLQAAGIDVIVQTFPDYDNPFGQLLYHGTLNKDQLSVEGRAAALNTTTEYIELIDRAKERGPQGPGGIYALDRWLVAPKLQDAIDSGKTVILDRYEQSNRAFQGGKIYDLEKRQAYFEHNVQHEYEWLKIMEPHVVVYLTLPIDVSLKRMNSRGLKLDNHEQNRVLLEGARQVYNSLVKMNPQKWLKVEGVDRHHGMRELSREEVHETLCNKLINYFTK